MLWKTGFAGISVIFFSGTFFSSSELYAVPKSQPDGAALHQHNPFDRLVKKVRIQLLVIRVLCEQRADFFFPRIGSQPASTVFFLSALKNQREQLIWIDVPTVKQLVDLIRQADDVQRSVPPAPPAKGSDPAPGRARAASF